MERVAFLIERTGQRVGCLLNPESLVIRRLAGIRQRRSANGPVTGARLADNPLLYTGGGTTDLELDLLFDVSLAGSSITTENVRDLTAPLWELAENSAEDGIYGRPPLVRFVWGKSWNIPGVITAVAERLEYFTSQGVPRRSWMRMRLVRVADSDTMRTDTRTTPQSFQLPSPEEEIPEEQVRMHEMLGGAGDSGAGVTGERLDEIASRYYGEPALWRLLAIFNEISDPMRVRSGINLRIPPLSAIGREP